MAKNKQSTFADLVADSAPETETVDLGGHSVTIQAMSGRDRFEIAEKEEKLSRWDLMLWICVEGVIEPKIESVEDAEKLKPEWIVKIATSLMKLSGIQSDEEEAKNESPGGNGSGGL